MPEKNIGSFLGVMIALIILIAAVAGIYSVSKPREYIGKEGFDDGQLYLQGEYPVQNYISPDMLYTANRKFPHGRIYGRMNIPICRQRYSCSY